MSVWLNISAGNWPSKIHIRVSLREGSKDGPRISGDVVVVIRKKNDPATTKNLGVPGNLIAKVVNGRWESPEWDYSYWANQGYDTLVAQFQGQEWSWSSISPKKDKPPVPTSITKIQYTSVVDQADQAKMLYALTWSILDQFGKPVASKVTVVFDGKTETRESEASRPGVCFDRVIVTGYDREMFYTVLPPIGEPQILKLRGPDKRQEAKASNLVATSDNGSTTGHTTNYNVTVWATDSKGQPIGGKRVTFQGFGEQLAGVTDPNGLVTHTVAVKTEHGTITYQAFIRSDGASSNQLELKGPAKKEEKHHTYQVEADLDTPHPVNGKFVISGTTKVDGKLATCECIISSAPEDAVVTARLGKLEPGSDPGTYKLTTVGGGRFKLVVEAKDNTLYITAPDGTTLEVVMIVPRRMI